MLYKRAVISPMLKMFPDRRFVLVGDSGEKDPEIYGELARNHPGQIVRIFIHNVTKEGQEAPRYKAAFRELPASLWQVFDDPAEVGKIGP